MLKYHKKLTTYLSKIVQLIDNSSSHPQAQSLIRDKKAVTLNFLFYLEE